MDQNNDNIIYPGVNEIIAEYVKQTKEFITKLNQYSINHSILESILKSYIDDENDVSKILSLHTNNPEVVERYISSDSDDNYQNKDLTIVPFTPDDIGNSNDSEDNYKVSCNDIAPISDLVSDNNNDNTSLTLAGVIEDIAVV